MIRRKLRSSDSLLLMRPRAAPKLVREAGRRGTPTKLEKHLQGQKYFSCKDFSADQWSLQLQKQLLSRSSFHLGQGFPRPFRQRRNFQYFSVTTDISAQAGARGAGRGGFSSHL